MSVALVMGSMIGSGVFLLPASLAPFGWNAVAGWIVTIAGAVCLAHVLATLAQQHARAIGPTELVEHNFGPIAGFLIGFSFWVAVWAGCATISVGAVSYLSATLPILGEHPALSALGLVWMVTIVNLFGARVAGSFQVLTMILKLTPLIVVMALIAMVFGTKGTAVLPPLPDEGLSLSAVNTAAAIALWALVGFEAALAASDKIENPQRNVARATMLGASLTGLIYLIVCSGVALMLPVEKVAGSAAPFAVFVETYWSAEVAAFVGLFAAISAIGAVNGWTLVQGELPLEMARRKVLPQWFAKTLKNGVPIRGLLISSVFSSLLILANSSRSMSGLFTFMALLTTSVTLWLYLACALAAIKERVAIPTAIIGLLFGIWSLIGAGWEASSLSLVLMLMGLPLYWWARRQTSKIEI